MDTWLVQWCIHVCVGGGGGREGGGGGHWPFGFSATMHWHALTGSSSERDGRGRGLV